MEKCKTTIKVLLFLIVFISSCHSRNEFSFNSNTEKKVNSTIIVDSLKNSVTSSYVSDSIYRTPDELGHFIGGIAKQFEYFRSNLNNSLCFDNDEHVVYVNFIIEKDSTVSNVKVIKGISEQLDREAIRIISSVKWVPGKEDNNNVRSLLTFPVVFNKKSN